MEIQNIDRIEIVLALQGQSVKARKKTAKPWVEQRPVFDIERHESLLETPEIGQDPFLDNDFEGEYLSLITGVND